MIRDLGELPLEEQDAHEDVDMALRVGRITERHLRSLSRSRLTTVTATLVRTEIARREALSS